MGQVAEGEAGHGAAEGHVPLRKVHGAGEGNSKENKYLGSQKNTFNNYAYLVSFQEALVQGSAKKGGPRVA